MSILPVFFPLDDLSHSVMGQILDPMKISKQLIEWVKAQGMEATSKEIETELGKLDSLRQRVIALRFDFEQKALMHSKEVSKEIGFCESWVNIETARALCKIKGGLQRDPR